MASVKDLSMDDLEHLIEQKVLEMLGDPDSGLELREEFKKELEERLKKPSKRVPQREVLNRSGCHEQESSRNRFRHSSSGFRLPLWEALRSYLGEKGYRTAADL